MAGRFPSAWLDDLMARADIVQVVSAYLPLKKEGHRYWGLCPFHHEKTASFSVTPDLNLYYCFGCKAGGNVVQFIMEMERLDFQDAVKLLAERMHVPLPEMDEDPGYEARHSHKERLLQANQEAARFYYQFLWTQAGRPVLDYLYGRGLSDGMIRRFGLGASPDNWDLLVRHLKSKGFTQDEVRDAGLCVVKESGVFDMFRNRAMFPIINAQGQVLGFGGRAMGNAMPKYMNTTDTPVFNKRLGVYAANLLKKQRDLKRVILVEGYMDVVSLTQWGIGGVVATLGTALTQEQARLLKRYAPEIWVAYDGDSAGQHAIVRALDIFESEAIPARVLYFPDELDPDEFIRQRGLEAFNALRPLPPTEYRLQREEESHDLSTEDGMLAYAKGCAAILRREKEPLELDRYLDRLAQKTGFSKEVLSAQVGVEHLPYKPRPKRENFSSGRAQPADEADKAEKMLLSLLATGKLPEGTVTAEDFADDTMRTLAAQLLSGKTPAALTQEADTERMRSLCAEVFSQLNDDDYRDAVVVAQECMHTLRIARFQKKVDEKKKAMAEAETDQERSAALMEIAELSKELSRLKARVR
ncbi:MAG: DNA primase [Clostridiales bacterium]|nr:DNA primase [Clostridiales bacterium]